MPDSFPIYPISRRNGVPLVRLGYSGKKPVLHLVGRGLRLHGVPDHAPLDVGEQVLGWREGGDGSHNETEGGQVGAYLVGSGMPFQAGKLVQAAQKPLGGTLAEGDAGGFGGGGFIPKANDQYGALLDTAFGLGQTDGERGLLPFPIGCAEQVEGTVTTLRLPGHAHQRPQLNEALGEVPCRVGGDKGSEGGFGGLLGGGREDVGVVSREAGQHPQDVAVHGGDGDPKGDRGHGPGGIAAHTGELEKGVEVGGYHAPMMLHDRFSGLLEVTNAAIVAQPLPELEQGGLVGVGESLHRGQGGQKAMEVGLDRLGAGLLEHDLRDQDAVWVGRLTPGKVAAVLAVPIYEEGDGCGGEGSGHSETPFQMNNEE